MSAPVGESDPAHAGSGGGDIEIEIAALVDLDLAALKLRWRNLFGRAAPDALPRALLAKFIAYRRQAEVFGDLDARTTQTLRRMASEAAGPAKPASAGSRTAAARPLLSPGTMLLREWKGETHRVTVMREGFAWNGVVHASLSRVAREITGVNWNGFVFFGVCGKRKSPPAAGISP